VGVCVCVAGQVRRQLRRRAKLKKDYEAECAIAEEEGLDKPKEPDQLKQAPPTGRPLGWAVTWRGDCAW
jgi:hypothetical protein